MGRAAFAFELTGKACKCGSSGPAGGSWPSCAATAAMPPVQARCGPWTGCTTSCSTAAALGAHGRRYLEPGLPGDARLPVGNGDGSDRCARTSASPLRPSAHDPARSGQSVHLEGARLVGLCQQSDARLQPAGPARRQRLRRELQRRVRMECLGQHWFLDLDDACQKVEAWRREYNEVRPHSAIGDRRPMSLIRQSLEGSGASKGPEFLI